MTYCGNHVILSRVPGLSPDCVSSNNTTFQPCISREHSKMKKHQILPLACSHFGYVMVKFKADSGNDLTQGIKLYLLLLFYA